MYGDENHRFSPFKRVLKGVTIRIIIKLLLGFKREQYLLTLLSNRQLTELNHDQIHSEDEPDPELANGLMHFMNLQRNSIIGYIYDAEHS